MLLIFTFVVCALIAYGMGKTSNGMTDPKVTFNIFTGPAAGIVGAVIGLIAGFFQQGILAHIASGFVVGLIAGLLGLAVARQRR